MAKRRVGIVGFGKLGQFLAEGIWAAENRDAYELAFVWNRNPDAIDERISPELRLTDLEQFHQYAPDLVVEVAHPVITQRYGVQFLEYCDYMAGSPTAFATLETERSMREAAAQPNGHGLYIPRGALPGLDEVLRMVDKGDLAGARIAMKKHPSSLKYGGPLPVPLSEITEETVVYDGPLRELCGLAPNNVNTMAVLAMASQLGFDQLRAQLVADPMLEHHITEVSLLGPTQQGPQYSLDLIRKSPAGPGAVTSTATLTTFLTSMLLSQGHGDGVFFK